MDLLQRALAIINKPAQAVGEFVRKLPSGINVLFKNAQPLRTDPAKDRVVEESNPDKWRNLIFGQPEVRSWQRPATPTPTQAPTATPTQMPSPTPTPQPSPALNQLVQGPQQNVGTTLEQLQNMANYVNKAGSPVAQAFPDLLRAEQDTGLPGLARVLAAISHIESNMGASPNVDMSYNNPFGLLQGGHGQPLIPFNSIYDAAKFAGNTFTDPNFVYRIPPQTPIDYSVVQQDIAPHYNIEGGPYWDIFRDLYFKGF
jgi:hypothetical protein